MANVIERNGFKYFLSDTGTATVSRGEVYPNGYCSIENNISGVPVLEEIETNGKKYRITSIGALVSCNNITIPSSVNSIGGLALCNNITIPSSVNSIGKMFSCSGITIPSSVKCLGDISGCSNMKIDFSKETTKLGCISGLSGVSLPDTITTIGGLNNCQDIIIPSSVTSIGRLRSYNSTLIVTIPSNVLTISEIDGEKSTMVLRMESKTPPVVGKVINIVKADQLVVPQGSLDAYKNDPMWGKFKTIREDPTLGKGAVSPQPQALAANNGNAEKEKVELKSQLAKKDEEIAELKRQLAQQQEEIAELKNQLAKKAEEIAELKRQSESKKASAEPKPQPAPAQPKPVQPSAPTSATAAVPKANGVFKLADYKSKGKLCHTIVKTYVEQHPDVTLAQLKQAFNVPKCEVVESLAVALTIKDSTGKVGGDYYIKENDQLKAKDGMVVVWSYWPERFYNPFMEQVKTLGYTIE